MAPDSNSESKGLRPIMLRIDSHFKGEAGE